jgi:hypothetical protein
MDITIPDLPGTIEQLLPLTSTFNGRMQTIAQWVEEQREDINRNRALLNAPHPDKIEILAVFLRDLLSRSMRGERSQQIYDAFKHTIITEDDLTQENYATVLEAAGYRWGVPSGSAVMCATVGYFRDDLGWNWASYFNEAENRRENGFSDDPLLKIKNVKYKVRDLALANFNPNYAAFDVHLPRVLARTGLLGYGWDIQLGQDAEFGTDPSNEHNYLFLHGLLLHMSALCLGQFSPVDLGRIFWHLGRSLCKKTVHCEDCPIHDVCLTGMQRAANG